MEIVNLKLNLILFIFHFNLSNVILNTVREKIMTFVCQLDQYQC